jgi:hypothetical protein
MLYRLREPYGEARPGKTLVLMLTTAVLVAAAVWLAFATPQPHVTVPPGRGTAAHRPHARQAASAQKHRAPAAGQGAGALWLERDPAYT